MGRLPSWPVWLIVIGAVPLVLAAVSVYLAVGFSAETVTTLARPGAVAPSVVLVALLGTLAMCIGLVAYVIRGSLSPQTATRGYASLGTIIACFATATILANVLTLPYFLFYRRDHPSAPTTLTASGLIVTAVAMEASLFGVVFVRIVNPGVITWEQMGLVATKFWERVAAGLLVAAAVIAGSYGLTAALERVGIHQTQQELFAGVQDASLGQFVVLALAVGVIVPICEEIFFRGYIFTAVRQRYGVAPAFVASSLLFALAHANVQAFLPLLFVGVSFCYVYSRTGSLVPSMLAHGINNTLAVAALYFTR